MREISRSIKFGLVLAVIITSGVAIWVISPYLFPPPPMMDDDLNMGEEVTVISSGTFNRFDSSHWGEGLVQLVQIGNTSHAIYFVNVTIASGPDLFVYLSNRTSFAGIGSDPGDYVDLGMLTSFQGNFSFSIPQSVNVTQYHSVLIWCRAFSVAFTYATLSP